MARFSMDLARAVVATFLITMAVYVSASAQYPDVAGHAGAADSLLPWALQQGGAIAVLCVVLFFYRRDWKTAVEFWKDQNTVRDTLVKEATKAQIETAAALREATAVIYGLKRLIQEEHPGRRFDDSDRR